jgi:large-conductance mechanosensitive channel
MKKRALYHFFTTATAIFLLVLTVNCSKNDEQHQDEKGRVEKITDQAAETAVKKIRTPMDKARATQNLGDDRLDEMDKAVQKQ